MTATPTPFRDWLDRVEKHPTSGDALILGRVVREALDSCRKDPAGDRPDLYLDGFRSGKMLMSAAMERAYFGHFFGDFGAVAERRASPPPFRRGIDELPDDELDEAIAAASGYVFGEGVGVSATPEARAQARRLYDAIAARLRRDGPADSGGES